MFRKFCNDCENLKHFHFVTEPFGSATVPEGRNEVTDHEQLQVDGQEGAHTYFAEKVDH